MKKRLIFLGVAALLVLGMVAVTGAASDSSNETILVGEEIRPGVFRYEDEEGIVAVVEDWEPQA